MQRAAGLAAFLTALALTGPAAAQVSCNQNGTQSEMTACVVDDYKRADADLNAAYQQVRASVPDDVKTALLQAQRLWIPYRDAACEAEASPYAGGSIQPMIHYSCLTRLTDVRTQDILQLSFN